VVRRRRRRTVILMVDGFGMDYYEESQMPFMHEMAQNGFFRAGKCIFPSLTNANNISIACGAWPEDHGVTTNCYFDETTGKAAFLEDAAFLCAPTIFERSKAQGVQSVLLTCKSKTTKILGRGVESAIAAEEPSREIVKRFGHPPPMYSANINYWLCEVALAVLNEQPEIGLIYIHTTDYPMHMWPADAPRSKAHMTTLDQYLGRFLESAPDAVFVVTADHGMNFKKRCWDLSKACSNRGLQLKFAVSPVADRLVKHHRGFGGVSYVYLNRSEESARATEMIGSLEGVEQVLDRHTAAARFKLMASRIGDLVVIPDIDTVFGDLPEEIEVLDPGYRSHGSLYETDIPLLLFNADVERFEKDEIRYNLDLTRLLFNPNQ
jgi:phosphonoacetate hydrolase